MEKILYEVGLQDFISICQQKSISIKTFEYIMSPESSALTRKIVCQDTGLTSSQIVDICGQIQKAKAKGQLPSSRSPYQTKSKALTGVYGRTNRIQKMVAQPNAVKPGFAHYTAPQSTVFPNQQQASGTQQMQQSSQKPSVVHQVSAAEPAKAEVEQIVEQPIISCQQEAIQPQETAIELQQNILEMSEKLQEFQTLDNKVSQEYLHQKLNDVANNDNTIERQFTHRDNDQDDDYSHSDKSEESNVQVQQVMNQPEKIIEQEHEDQNMILEEQPVQAQEIQNQRKQSIDSDEQLMINAQQYKASQDQLQALSAQKADQLEESSHEGNSYDPEIDQDMAMEQLDQQKPVEQNPQFAQNQQQAYSESKSEVQSDDEDDSNSKVSDQRFRAQGPQHQQAQPLATQVHHSRPTFGVKQPVSHHIQDDYSESELDSEENVLKPENNVAQEQNMIHQNANQERYISQSIQSSYSNEQSEEVRHQPVPQHQNFQEISEDEDDGLPSDSEFQNQMQEKKQQNNNIISQSLWGQHNQAQPAPASSQLHKQEDKNMSDDEDNSSSSSKSSDEEAENQQSVPQAYQQAAPQQNQSFHQTDKNFQQNTTQIQEVQNEPQNSSVISPSKILQNIDNQNILNSYPNHHMMYNSEIKNTFNQSTVQQEQPCTFEVGQMVTNHHNNGLQSLSANQNDHLTLTGNKYRDYDETDKLTVDEFYPLIDPKIKNQIAAKVRLELQDEVKEKVREELTQTVTQEVQTLLKSKIEHDTEQKVKRQVTLEITEKVAQETESRLKQKYEQEQQEKNIYQMEQFSREKEEMAITMRKLQDIIKSKENEMQKHELENQQFVMTLNDKINKQNEKMIELEDDKHRQLENQRKAEIARQEEEAIEAAQKQKEEELEKLRIMEAEQARYRAQEEAKQRAEFEAKQKAEQEQARYRAEQELKQQMERQAEIERLNEIRRREEERAEYERIRIQQLETLRKANEEKAQYEAALAAAEAQRVIEAQKQVEARKQAELQKQLELQKLLEAQKQQEIRQQIEALERQKAIEVERQQQMLKAQEEERVAIEHERQNLLRIEQQEREEQQRLDQEEEQRLRNFEAESRRHKDEEDRMFLIKKREEQEKLRQMQVQKAEQEKAILIQKQEQLKILMELKNQEEEQMKQRQKLEEQERMRSEKERLDKIRKEMNEQEELRQLQIRQEEEEEMERKQRDIQDIINLQTIVVPKTDTNNSIEEIQMNQMKSEDKLSELQEKQKQLDQLKAVQKQLEEEKQKSNLAMIAQQNRNAEELAILAEEKRNADEKIIKAQAEKLYQLEIQNAQLLEQNKNIKFSQLSAQKSNHSTYSQNGIPIINLEDDNDIDDSPSKQKYLSHAGKEESSYLPDIVPQEQLVKKKEKIIKKVRFHDDDPVTVLPTDQQRVGTKRNLYKNSSYTTIEDEEDVDEQAIMDEEECDEQFAKITQNLKSQKLEDQTIANVQREDRQARNMRRKTYSEDAYVYSDNDDDDWDRRDKRVAHKRKNKHDGKQTASTSKSGASPATTEHGSTSKFSATSPFKSTGMSKEYNSKMSEHLKSIGGQAQKNPQLMKMLEKIAFKR